MSPPLPLPLPRPHAVDPHHSAASSFSFPSPLHDTNLEQTKKQLQDQKYMKLALEQAQKAYDVGEVPVGAVLIGPDGSVVAAAFNTTETDCDPTAHAEMHCIRQASRAQQGWRLLQSTLYVTLEPCPMCAGALLQSRVGRVVYGAKNTLLGADGGWIDMLRSNGSRDSGGSGDDDTMPATTTGETGDGMMTMNSANGGIERRRPHPFHPDIKVDRGVMQEECGEVMKKFFKQRRRG